MAKENRELFPIGEGAKMFRVSVGTLRHYEKIGLLAPEFVAPDTGYRYYSTRQLECLNTIRYLRVLEMPLEQIREFLQNREVEKIQEMLQQQKEVVVQKQRALEIVQRKIENRLRQIQDALASELDVIRQVDMPARRIAWLHDTLTPKTYLDLEPSIRQLEQPAQESVVFLAASLCGCDPQIFFGSCKWSVYWIYELSDDIFQSGISSCREKYLAVFRNLYSVTGGFVTGSCCPAKWTWKKSEAADENRISASNGHSSCFCGNFMESTL